MTRAALTLTVTLAAIAAAGCSAPGSTHDRAPTVAAGAAPGGTITVGVTAPGSLDPADVAAPSARQILSLVCEPLVSFDPRTAKLVPGIATTWVSSSGGGMISVQLRRGVRYHSGGKVNARDVVATLSRVASVDTASVHAPILEDVAGYDAIHGVVEADNDLELKELRGLVSASDDTLQITQDRNAGRSALLGHLVAAPLPGGLARRDDASLASDPDCAGPYRLEAPYKASQTTITLNRFDRYYGRNAAHPRGGKGFPDAIVFKIFPDREAELKAFLAGEIDIAQVPETPLPPAGTGPGSALVSAANGHVQYVGFPRTEGSPLADPQVRAALSQAIDRQALARDALNGAAQPASGFLPPTVGDTYHADACGPQVPATAAIEAAKGNLAAAEVDLRGFGVKLYYDDEFSTPNLAAAVAKQWQQALGVRVQLMPLDWRAFRTRATLSGGFDGAFIDSWTAPYPSADGYLHPLFDSNATGGDNFSHAADPLVHDAIHTARITTDATARALNYRAVEVLLCKDLPMVPLVFRDYRYLVRTSRVGAAIGSYTDASSGLLNLRDVYVKTGS